MRALFITPVGRYNYSEPIGLMQLVAVLKEAGHDARIELDSFDRALKAIREYQPDMVGFSVVTRDQERMLDLNRRLKREVGFLSVLGGPHPTFFPRVIEDPDVDVVFQGEAEDALLDMAHAMDEGKPYYNIPNIWAKDEQGVVHENDVRPLREDLDELPFPDRESFYTIFDRSQGHGLVRFMVGRGCPYNCAYCFNKHFYALYEDKGKRVRFRSPENVVAEVQQVNEKHPFQLAVFGDDCFPFQEEWLERFRDLYMEKVGLPWFCNQRVERITPTSARLMKEANCYSVLIGLEHGNEQIRRDILRRNMTNDDIVDAVRMLKDNGIVVFTNNMIGIPGDTLETAMDTLDFNLKLKPAQAAGFFYQPHPGTDLSKTAEEMGLYDGSMKGVGFLERCADAYKIPDAQRLQRLRALLTPVVMMPWLRPLVPTLLNLPLDRFYGFVSRCSVGYLTKFRCLPTRLGPRRFAGLLYNFMLKEDPF